MKDQRKSIKVDEKIGNNLPRKKDPQPICKLQVRFVVWETEDMKMMNIEGISNIYIIGYIDQKENERKNNHFLCQTSVPYFNWRMLLLLRLPVQINKLTIQILWKRYFSSDDNICGTTLNLKDIVNVFKLLEMTVGLTKEFYGGLTD